MGTQLIDIMFNRHFCASHRLPCIEYEFSNCGNVSATEALDFLRIHCCLPIVWPRRILASFFFFFFGDGQKDVSDEKEMEGR